MQIGKSGASTTRISQAYPDRVEVRGRDLSGDLMGRLSFTEYFHLLLTGREPTDDQRFFLDLLLVAIAEHGMMPSNVAARDDARRRPRLAPRRRRGGDPGLRPGRPGHVRVRARGCSKRRRRGPVRRRAGRGRARRSRATLHASGDKVPGFGHPVHRPLDPRAERILELAGRPHGQRPARRCSRAAFARRSPRPRGSRCR